MSNETDQNAALSNNMYSERHYMKKPQTFLGVYRYSRTYLNLIYLLATFPIGIIFFVYSVTAFSVSAGLIFTFIGIILMWVFLWSLPKIMYAHGLMTKYLVGIDLPVNPYEPYVEGGFIKKATSALKDKRIWKTFFYFLIPAMPIGIFFFTLVVTLISVSLSLLAYPWVIVVESLRGHPNVWGLFFFNNFPALAWFVAIAAPIVGFFLLPATLHLCNKLAEAHGKFVQQILSK